ncbi:MAG: hypothetical protein U0934_09645 [Pseudotabrizicola sp.]|uniref:hypothetical protein n=1 Tax=Pseudotabrizicola sp. TaxID=2939647 RepID=UPI002728DB4A|nr:hypothetical protein [Pseudotabrizicola sp.]MDO8884141.1 hypothetical protein [Pseudotabrizicola sp.]MDP2082453.1 hypothetical protein [Pseudotabrizicola sp.]MDZ7574206.1 hypothetical protein [Pseudotabrizicola sp.]
MSEFETVLAPLAQITRKNKAIEAYVYWHKDGAWSDASGESLDSEEITFYAEGLLMEGFGLAWDHLSDPDLGDLIRLCFWQGTKPELPALTQVTLWLSGGASTA